MLPIQHLPGLLPLLLGVPSLQPPVPLPVAAEMAEFDASAFGRSGALRVALAMPGEAVGLPLRWTAPRPADLRYRWVPVAVSAGRPGGPLGEPLAMRAAAAGRLTADDRAAAPERPGVYELELVGASTQRMSGLQLVVLTPTDRMREGRINGYHVGRYPAGRSARYAPPRGYVEVTEATRGLRLSEHLSIGEFLTHDQRDHWPKYVVVDLRLIDKIELLMDELTASGIPAERVVVMSGYRTPQYNRRGLSQGRASNSRHQYGDAADIWIDNDGDWYMDDLDRDGRRDLRDARVMLGAVERVEDRHPDLIGGAGLYPDNGAHGPFIHIDARGSRARW